MRQPPTDNLYKFIAIFGLVLVIGSGYVLLDKSANYERQVATWSAAWVPLVERIHAANENAIKRLDCAPHSTSPTCAALG